MSDAERRLREVFAEGAGHAPSADGLAAAVHGRIHRRRRRRTVAAAAAVVVLAIGGGIAVTRTVEPMETSAAGAAAPRSAGTLVGTWRPIEVAAMGLVDDNAMRRNPPNIEFTADGQWTASDGCNTSAGRYEQSPTFSARTTRPTTLIGCDNVPNEDVLVRATGYDLIGDRLVFHGEGGEVLGTYQRVNV
ncbi:META domain-containing protein [Actinokineospora sp. NBRC 105648]|uniref:META domain-containing protein n=1 Tax=Actinokineospora sp. NBRC 105648 TaxID=3032206 RepID=UPI0024A23D90|nr:META domain-containing protein [Actinokineospora sp. NBRC 105648]GLZ38626.1 hypothetical protein Acsp05_22500 [Actinokineospora sp. NBRC 105648]